MSNQTLPKHFEPYKLADKEVGFSGTWSIAQFERLSGALASPEGELQIELMFFRGEDGFRELTGRVTGVVSIQCQRCMDPMSFDLDADIHLGLAYDDDMARSLPKRLDALVVSPDQALTLSDLIEDDLILNLPAFALHDEGECELQVTTEYSDPEPEKQAVQETDKINPFSILAQLKKPEDDN